MFQAIELLYKLISSDNKLVVKTAIKLLLVFIEYNESNYILLIDAVRNVASETETIPWSNLIGVMSGRQIYILKDLKSNRQKFLKETMLLTSSSAPTP